MQSLETSTVSAEPASAAAALSALVGDQIVQRLRAAAESLRQNPPETTQACDLLSDALDRVRALQVADVSGKIAAPSYTILAASGGRPVREFLLIAFGDVQVERPVAGESFEFTREHADAAIAWFTQMGRKLAIDYEHQTFDALNTRPDGLRPAAGWIGGLEVRDDGLWAVDVTWTERATNLLRSGEYRYFSPVLFWRDEQRTQLAGLGPVALTNDPAMRGVQALAASRAACETEPAAPSSGPSAGPRTAQVPQAAYAAHLAPDPSLGATGSDLGAAHMDTLSAAHAEIDLLRQQLADQRADQFIERGLRSGKITLATRDDWRGDFLRDAAQTEDRLRRAPVILPPGRLAATDARSAAGFTATPARGGASPLFDPQSGAFVESADLAAYERASAAGFVRFAGPR